MKPISHRRIWGCIVVIGNLLVSGSLPGQAYLPFGNLSVKEGLSQSSVYSILQDKDGFLWFGTNEGLNRYDGHTFVQYKNDPRNKNSLSSPVVLCLTEDEEGLIWIGTNGGGLVCFNKYTSTFRSFVTDISNPESITNNKVWGICEINRENLGISTFGGGALIFNKKSGQFTPLQNKQSISDPNDLYATKIICYDNKLICFGTRNGFKIFDIEKNILSSYNHDTMNINSIADDRIQSVYMDKQHRIWIGTFNGYFSEFHPENGTFDNYKIENPEIPSGTFNAVNDFLDTGDGILWIATFGKGMYRYYKSEKKLEVIKSDSYYGSPSMDPNIICLHDDKSGILWAGTMSNGVICYHPEFNNFRKINSFINPLLNDKNIYSIYKDADKNLWIGTNGGGLTSFDSSLQFRSFYHSDSKNPKFQLNNNNIWAIKGDSYGRLWIGSMGGGITLLNQSGDRQHQLMKQNNDSSGLLTNNTWSFTMNPPYVLISTQTGGVTRYDASRNTFFNFQKKTDGTGLNSSTVYVTTTDSRGNIFFGTKDGGLNIREANTGNISYYIHQPDNIYSISNNDVYSLLRVNDSTYWCGTNGGGLNLFLKSKKIFYSFTEKEGLPNNVIYSIFKDENHQLWISTNKGIGHVLLPENFYEKAYLGEVLMPVVRSYTTIDGLPSNEFNQGAAFQDEDGMIYFGSIGGITGFHPGKLLVNTNTSPVCITAFRVFEKYFPIDTVISYKKSLTLKYNENYFSFEFANLNFLLPEKNTYAVKLEGLDPDWIFTGSRHFTSYTNLDPGYYIFRVRGYNNDGILSSKEAVLYITITPPFWKTWWFKLTIGTLFLLSVYLFYQDRIRKIKREEKKKSDFRIALSEVEMKALRAQMNPHFIFNSLNSINSFVLENNAEAASSYLSRFSKLIRLVFENSMHKTVTLNDDLAALDLYVQMEKLRFGNKINYLVNISPEIDAERVLIPPLLIQPFVENALLHGILPGKKEGNLNIFISREDQLLLIIIRDDGIGRHRSAMNKLSGKSLHKSYGIKVTNERIDLLNTNSTLLGSVKYIDHADESGNSTGTSVEIRLPYEIM